MHTLLKCNVSYNTTMAFKIFNRIVLFALLSACATPSAVEDLKSLSAQKPLRDDGDLDSIMTAALTSLQWSKSIAPTRAFTYADRKYTAAELTKALTLWIGHMTAKPTTDPLASIREYFDVYSSTDKDGGITVTGYYIPTIEGSLKKSKNYPVPVYPPPADLLSINLGEFGNDLEGRRIRGRIAATKFVPYYDRSKIRSGILDKKVAKPIAWVKNEWDLFNVEIQGTGRLRLPSGKERLLAYADRNGHPYRSVGKLLVDEKKLSLEQASMQSIQSYLQKNPKEVGRVLSYNPSFVFFRFSDEVEGSLGFPLTAGRSVAADQSVIPAGLPMFLATTGAKKPSTIARKPLKRFVFNHDSGGAIKGNGRIDYYAGQGRLAGEAAGIMRDDGKLFVFLPKTNL
jgi:membrane-bound lytic murein transglycosylase A